MHVSSNRPVSEDEEKQILIGKFATKCGCGDISAKLYYVATHTYGNREVSSKWQKYLVKVKS